MFNEQDSVRPLLERLETTLRPLGIPFEVVAVDDGSSDGTRAGLLAFQPLARELSVVCLSRNFGLEGAIEAGLRHARGDAVVLMDADLQDPPELIPTLLDAWRNGAEVVFTTKRSRAEPLARRAAFGGFHLLYHRLARIPSPLGAGNFSLVDRAALDAVLAMPERSRYLPGLRYWVGFRQVEVAYDRPGRAAGLDRHPRRVPEPRLRRGPAAAQLHRARRAPAVGRRGRRVRAGEPQHPERAVACWSGRGGTRRGSSRSPICCSLCPCSGSTA